MTVEILIASVILISFIALSRVTDRLRIPMLLGFIVFGLVLGNDPSMLLFFSDYPLTETICSSALIIVMFYGGFGTSWKHARKVAVPAALLASVGTALTALLCGLFCHWVLRMPLLEGLLLGALLSSTDAASVFSILRTQKLNLKDGTDSLLEVESGSNDPFAYMLMMIFLTLMKGEASPVSIGMLLALQIGVGILCGILVFYLSKIWKLIGTRVEGFKTVFVLALALLAYSLADVLQGNGYLAVYLFGILLGNSRLGGKKELVHFFNGFSALMQMIIFFFLGLLARPTGILHLLPVSFTVFLFLSLIARPAAVFSILSCFRRSWQQMTLVSFAGLRGAASIVFAIMATVDDAPFQADVFHIVTGVVLFSLVIQGTLLPWAARKLQMVDASHNVMKTFNDYSSQADLQFSQIRIRQDSPWNGLPLASLRFPKGMAVALISRNGHSVAPAGNTVIQTGDLMILTTIPYHSADSLLDSEVIEQGDERIGQSLANLHSRIPKLVCLGRNGEFLIPDGQTILKEEDTLVFVQSAEDQDPI